MGRTGLRCPVVQPGSDGTRRRCPSRQSVLRTMWSQPRFAPAPPARRRHVQAPHHHPAGRAWNSVRGHPAGSTWPLVAHHTGPTVAPTGLRGRPGHRWGTMRVERATGGALCGADLATAPDVASTDSIANVSRRASTRLPRRAHAELLMHLQRQIATLPTPAPRSPHHPQPGQRSRPSTTTTGPTQVRRSLNRPRLRPHQRRLAGRQHLGVVLRREQVAVAYRPSWPSVECPMRTCTVLSGKPRPPSCGRAAHHEQKKCRSA